MRASSILALSFVAAATAACSGSTTVDMTTGSGGSTGSSTGNSTGTGMGGGSGTSTGSSTGTGGDASAKACADLVKERCTHADACSNAHSTQVLYGDEATCEKRGQIACLDALGAPGTSATAATSEACATANAAETCEALFDNNPPAACLPQPGEVADGGGCAANGQCTSTYCAVGKDEVCGKCAAPPKPGDSCAVFPCGHGLACDRTSELCVVPGMAGAVCDGKAPCASGLGCVGNGPMTKGTCQPEGTKAGDACDPKKQTAADCDRNLGFFCNPLSKSCEAFTYVGANQPCGVVAAGFAVCTAGGLCNIPMGNKAGVCIAAAADGAACDTTIWPPCLRPAQCVAPAGSTKGICTLPDAAKCM